MGHGRSWSMVWPHTPTDDDGPSTIAPRPSPIDQAFGNSPSTNPSPRRPERWAMGDGQGAMGHGRSWSMVWPHTPTDDDGPSTTTDHRPSPHDHRLSTKRSVTLQAPIHHPRRPERWAMGNRQGAYGPWSVMVHGLAPYAHRRRRTIDHDGPSTIAPRPSPIDQAFGNSPSTDPSPTTPGAGRWAMVKGLWAMVYGHAP